MLLEDTMAVPHACVLTLKRWRWWLLHVVFGLVTLFSFAHPALAEVVPLSALPVYSTSFSVSQVWESYSKTTPPHCVSEQATPGIVIGINSPLYFTTRPGPGWTLIKTPGGMSWPLNDPANSVIVLLCDQFAVDQLRIYEPEQGSSTDWFVSSIRWVFSWLAQWIAQLGAWALNLAGHLIGYTLSFSTFVTHRYVVAGWPISQGVANLGFILALLTIAFATVLRVETFGARRMLPRLFIAALLINFSLVIGGVLIDASRVAMAAFSLVMVGNANINNIGWGILQSSSLVNAVFVFNTDFYGTGLSLNSNLAASSSWKYVLHVWQAAIMIWVLSAGLLVAAFMLLWRYIILLLLLIVSPLAYLSFAFPGMSSLAHKWWDNFLRWVIMGPVVFFILLLLVRVGGLSPGISAEHYAISSVLDIIFTSLLAMASVFAGKYVGGIGAATMVNVATSAGKQARNFAWRNKAAVAGGMVGAGAGPVGAVLGAALLGTKTGRRLVGSTLGGAADRIVPGLRGSGGGFRQAYRSYQDRKEQERRARERASFGATVGRAIFPSATAQQRRDAQTQAQDIRTNNTRARAHHILAPALNNPLAAQRLSPDEINNLVTNIMESPATTPGHKLNVVNNIEIVKHIKEGSAAEAAVYTLNDANLIRLLHDTRRRVKDAEQRAGGTPPPPGGTRTP